MALDYASIVTQFGSSFWVIILLAIWDGVWKLFAMWKAATKQKSVVWFIALAIFNTVGILPILYIYVFSEMGKEKKKKRKK